MKINRMLLCSHQTQRNSLLLWTWWLVVNNPIGFPPQPVFGHAHFGWSCETFLRANLRVESVPLIQGTDRGHTGSALWELLFVRAVTQQCCQKVIRFTEWMWSRLQNNTLHYNKKFTTKGENNKKQQVLTAPHMNKWEVLTLNHILQEQRTNSCIPYPTYTCSIQEQFQLMLHESIEYQIIQKQDGPIWN